MQKKNRKSRRETIRNAQKITWMYWNFVRESPTHRGRFTPLLWKLAESTDLFIIESVLTFLKQTPKEDQRLLLTTAIDVCVALPRQLHSRLLSLIDQVHTKVSISAVLKHAPMLLFRFDDVQLAAFISYCLAYPTEELRIRALSLSHRKAQQFAAKQTGEDLFLELKSSLTLYAQAHCNRPVSIEVAHEPYTDGFRIHVPAKLSGPNAKEMYRIFTALNAGYIEFGTLDVDLRKVEGDWAHLSMQELEIERMFRSFSNRVLAKDLFFLFEDHRIGLHVQREYPGIAHVIAAYITNEQDKQKLRTPVDTFIGMLRDWVVDGIDPKSHQELIKNLPLSQLEFGDVHESIRLLQKVYPYAAGLLEKSSSYTSQKSSRAVLNTKKMRQEDRELRITWERRRYKNQAQEDFDFQEASEFMERMEAPAGPRQEGKEKEYHPTLIKDADPLEGEWCYPEWDVDLQDEKPNFTKVMELIIKEKDSDFVGHTKNLYRHEIQQIRRVFSAVQPQEYEIERHLDSGSILDMEAILAGRIESRVNLVDIRPYKAHRKNRRSVSVLFLVDLSSSTNELVGVSGKRIIDIQKESLVLIAEALEAMGDHFSMYGFSGYGRDQVAVYPIKKEEESWGTIAQNRLGNMSWRMENRDGAAIRHATQILHRGEGMVKILILLSDGRPLDCGCSLYHGSYSQTDTREALNEAKKKGVRPFCITVDSGDTKYLSSMYGTSFAVIQKVEDLPIRLPMLYHRLIQ